MKKHLKILKINLITGIFLLSLIMIYSCSQNEELENINDESSLIDVVEDDENDDLSGKKKDPKRLSGGCDNPRRSDGQYYRQYESTDVGAGTDLVSKTAINGKNVDVIKFLDDRTCGYNYSQSGNRGIYRLKAGSNKFDAPLQPRIERTTKKVDRKKGNFVSVEGYVNVKRVGGRNSGTFGFNDPRDQRGTYIIQAKGTHANKTIGSPDPAILLIVAKDRGNGTVDLWAEQIKVRGGTTDKGREMKKLANVRKNQRFKLKMTNGFSTDTKQYVKIEINNRLVHTFNVKNTIVTIRGQRKFQTGRDAKIRFGAYRCHKGEANIEWSDVRHDFKG